MLPKTSEEKASAEPTIIIRQTEMAPPVAKQKSRHYRQYIVIAVIAVVAAAVILTAILVGMHLFTKAQKDILKLSYTRDENVKEDVISDPNTNIVQYHVSEPTHELWVIDDFNRDIQVMKMKEERGTNCFVAPLNRTMAVDPSKVTLPSNTKKRNDSNAVTYRASDTPIPDTWFLSKAAKDTCQGISTYWVYPSCETPKVSPEWSSRQKRHWPWLPTWTCEWIWHWGICIQICFWR